MRSAASSARESRRRPETLGVDRPGSQRVLSAAPGPSALTRGSVGSAATAFRGLPEMARRAVAIPGLAVAPGSDPLGGSPVPPDVVSVLRRRRGRGAPHGADVAHAMGERLETDLTGVRVHTDHESALVARTLQATALTHGDDVYFSAGAYAPHSGAGRRLLAHELAHIAQNRTDAASSATAPLIGRADDPAEAEADRIADRVVGGLSLHAPQPPGPGSAGPTAAGRNAAIQRSVGKSLEQAGSTRQLM
jgi:hypothetical protein